MKNLSQGREKLQSGYVPERFVTYYCLNIPSFIQSVPMSSETAIGYGLQNPGFESRQEQCIYLLQNIQTGPGVPFRIVLNGYRNYLQLKNLTWHDIDHSSPPNARLKMSGFISPIPLYAIMVLTATQLRFLRIPIRVHNYRLL